MFWFCLNKTKGAALIKRPANLIVKTELPHMLAAKRY